LKALGWRSRRIIVQVLGESAAIGVAGAADVIVTASFLGGRQQRLPGGQPERGRRHRESRNRRCGAISRVPLVMFRRSGLSFNTERSVGNLVMSRRLDQGRREPADGTAQLREGVLGVAFG
jgi:hypothetical protein